MKLKNKKGSHVGMILSFTIFVTAIIFAYTIIGSPFKVTSTKMDSIDLLKVNLLNELAEEVIIVRTFDTINPCIQFETPDNFFSSIDIISIKSNGDEVASKINGGNTEVLGGQGFVKIYYAESGFTQALNTPGALCSPNEPKSVSHEQIILEQTILNTILRVQNDYDNLTRDLKVSGNDEINILFDSSDGLIGTETRDIKTDIYARNYKISYLSKEGQLKTGGLIVNLW